MSYEIVRTSQFRKDYKLMRKRGKDKQKLEEILRHSFSCYFAKNFLHGHELPHDNLCRRAAITTAEPPEPCRLRGAKSPKLKAESKCTTNN